MSHARSSWEIRLEELGYILPVAPPPAAIYLPFMRTGQQLWVAGQIAVREGELIHRGLVGVDSVGVVQFLVHREIPEQNFWRRGKILAYLPTLSCQISNMFTNFRITRQVVSNSENLKF